MKKLRIVLGILLLVFMLALAVSTTWAQDVTPDVTPSAEAPVDVIVVEVTEAPPVVEQPPVVVIETPAEQPAETPFSWRDVITGGLFLVAMILLGFSHPPSAGKLWKDLIAQVQKRVVESDTPIDDTAMLVLEPTLQRITERLEALDRALAQVTVQNGDQKSIAVTQEPTPGETVG